VISLDGKRHWSFGGSVGDVWVADRHTVFFSPVLDPAELPDIPTGWALVDDSCYFAMNMHDLEVRGVRHGPIPRLREVEAFLNNGASTRPETGKPIQAEDLLGPDLAWFEEHELLWADVPDILGEGTFLLGRGGTIMAGPYKSIGAIRGSGLVMVVSLDGTSSVIGPDLKARVTVIDDPDVSDDQEIGMVSGSWFLVKEYDKPTKVYHDRQLAYSVPSPLVVERVTISGSAIIRDPFTNTLYRSDSSGSREATPYTDVSGSPDANLFVGVDDKAGRFSIMDNDLHVIGHIPRIQDSLVSSIDPAGAILVLDDEGKPSLYNMSGERIWSPP
jgi:hypothetical protein